MTKRGIKGGNKDWIYEATVQIDKKSKKFGFVLTVLELRGVLCQSSGSFLHKRGSTSRVLIILRFDFKQNLGFQNMKLSNSHEKYTFKASKGTMTR